MALLALKRFCRRTLRQMGIGAIALLFVVGITAHHPEAQSSNSLSHHRAVVSMSLTSPTHSAKPSKPGQTESVGAADLIAHKPFQTIRPKMTYHRLTTSRFSIPPETHQTVASLSAHQ